MTIIQLKYFLVTADCGNLQKASEKLYITHQALSKQIKAIEKELDAELFDRSNKRQLVLTKEGKILFDTWKEIIVRHDEAIAAIESIKQAKKESLSIGIQDMPKIRIESISAFSQYRAIHSDSNFDYKMGTPEEILSLLDSNDINMAILFSPSVVYPEKYRYCIINAHTENPVIAVSVDNPLSQKASLSLKELENETFIMISSEYSEDIVKRQQRDFIANNMDPEKVRIRTVQDPNELVMALVMNQGVALVHNMLLDEVRDKVKTFQCTIAEENISIGTIIVWKSPELDDIVKEISALF